MTFFGANCFSTFFGANWRNFVSLRIGQGLELEDDLASDYYYPPSADSDCQWEEQAT